MDFTNRFGLLTDPEGEPFAAWVVAVANMYTLVRIWEEAQALGDHCHAHVKPVPSLVPAATFEFLAAEINQRILQVRTVLVPNSDSLVDGLTLRPMPTNLLGAMWLQFGQAVEANRFFRECRQCGRWFGMSPKGAGIDRVFCTDACKARAYRRRQAKKDDDDYKVEADNE